MSNTTTATKPMWIRCKGCVARIFNESVDVAAHRANCPADLNRKLQKLAATVDKLAVRVEELGGQVDETLEVLTTDPSAVDEEGFATIDETDPLAEPTPNLDDAFADDEEDDLDAIDLPTIAGRV